MKLMRMLSEMIEDELDDAEKYARKAVKFKESNPTLAKTFYDLSTDEMRHMSLLHTESAKAVEQYRKEHGEPPADMRAVYDYLHERHIDHSKEVKAYQDLYKGS